MAHDHSNDHHSHDHSHDHSNDHSHDHSHASSPSLSFNDKMVKLLAHWIQHNDDHASNYRDWANQATEKGLSHIAEKLEDAARLTDQITDTFTEANQLLHTKSK